MNCLPRKHFVGVTRFDQPFEEQREVKVKIELLYLRFPRYPFRFQCDREVASFVSVSEQGLLGRSFTEGETSRRWCHAGSFLCGLNGERWNDSASFYARCVRQRFSQICSEISSAHHFVDEKKFRKYAQKRHARLSNVVIEDDFIACF